MKTKAWVVKQEQQPTMKKNKNDNTSSSIKIQSWTKPTTLFLLLSLLLSISLLLSLRENHAPPYETTGEDPCHGRYIYIHNLPSRFNLDILEDCESITRPKDKVSMCRYAENSGFGPMIGSSSLYATNQFMLEVIFHERMKRYECLTTDSSMASGFYVPFYAGLDFRRSLRWRKVAVRDAAGMDLVRWLREQPQWKGMSGQDHFIVTGRISRDFQRHSDNNSDWGSNFMLLPESQNLTFLTIERSPLRLNEFAIPYPTYFHPSTATEILRWQETIRATDRTVLFSIAGAQRFSRNQNLMVRAEVIQQCKNSNTCKFLDCDVKSNGCDDPLNLMKLFQSSVFCLQPPGDSPTRRSIFDSILAGCIPVFFNRESAYEQYTWHLPKEDTEYSVYIPVKKLRIGGKSKIEEILRSIPEEREVRMRENIINLVPKIVYSEPNRNKPGKETDDDAFDIAVKGALERIRLMRRNQFMKEELVVYK